MLTDVLLVWSLLILVFGALLSWDVLVDLVRDVRAMRRPPSGEAPSLRPLDQGRKVEARSPIERVRRLVGASIVPRRRTFESATNRTRPLRFPRVAR